MAEKPISPLRKLQSAAVKLNQLSDQTADRVRQVEETLNELSLGIPVSVQMSSGTRNVFLEYRRRDDRSYHIAVVTQNASGNTIDVKPWTQCSREQKLEALKEIPQLIDELVFEVDQRIIDAQKALDSLSRFVPPGQKGGDENGRG